MIYIYKVNTDDEIKPDLFDVWKDGKFLKSGKKIDKDEVINTFNNGYFFTSEDKKIKINNEKILINKVELTKAVNLGAESGEAGFTFAPPSYDKKNRKYEDKVVTEITSLMKESQKTLEAELKRFYESS